MNGGNKKAIIFAAGYGMRMVPINTEIPKGLIEVQGQRLIDRIIEQFHEAGVCDITVVVGFMKEKYEYLIDKYNVKLIVNAEYSKKNNLYSLNLALSNVSNTYIVPCDVWCKNNPFNDDRSFSWYMVSDELCKNSNVILDSENDLVRMKHNKVGNHMIGISYINETDSKWLKKRVMELADNELYDNAYWEEALYSDGKMKIKGRLVSSNEFFEINTYEQLRELDSHSNQLQTDAIQVIEEVFHVSNEEIQNIQVLKKGMTNRSFLFTCKGEKFIMRIPGEGTDQLINRKEEAEVYSVIKDKNICDDIIYMNPSNGYKITKFLESARVCDCLELNDLRICMNRLRNFHQLKLKVNHTFDLFKKIEFYESLWNGEKSAYSDYLETKNNVFKLKSYIDENKNEFSLTHIDAVPDNFLFTKEDVRLIDWEYASMQDPHVDVAMFCIYSLYDKEQIDRLIDIYFENQCDVKTRIKIYCYISVCGLLWSNWCEYKRNLGVEFGEYSLKQYRYAKEYYRIAIHEMKEGGLNSCIR